MNGRPFREPGAVAEPQPPATARGVVKHMRAASVLMSHPCAPRQHPPGTLGLAAASCSPVSD